MIYHNTSPVRIICPCKQVWCECVEGMFLLLDLLVQSLTPLMRLHGCRFLVVIVVIVVIQKY